MPAPIIVGFDGSEHAQDALALGRTLAQALSTRLIVVIVYTPEEWLWRPGTTLPLSDGELARISAQASAALPAEDELEVRPVASPSAAGALHAEAEHEQALLIVVGSSHREKLGRIVLGDVTQDVLTAAPCPVAVAPAGGAARPSSLATIGVGFDDTCEAFAALAVARSLAHSAEARLHILWAAHLVERTLPFAAVSYARPNYFKEIREELDERLGRAADPLREELDVRTELLSGETIDALVKASEHLDLLILGSRSFGPLKRVLLGSVSRGVMSRAGCPVLVVPRGVNVLGEPSHALDASHAALT